MDRFIDITIEGRIAIVRFDRQTKSNALSAEAIRQITGVSPNWCATGAMDARRTTALNRKRWRL